MDLEQLHPDVKNNFLIQRLEEAPENKRAREAIRLLHNFDIPGSTWIPYIFIPRQQTNIYEEKFEEVVSYARDFFKYILSLNLPSEDNKWVAEHFIKDLDRREKISRSWLKQYHNAKDKLRWLRNLPHHRMPSYLYEWKINILGEHGKWNFKGRAQQIYDLRDLTFTKKLLGTGGFADVYLVLDPERNKYALKLFDSSWQHPLDEFEGASRNYTNEKIVGNVEGLKEILKEFQGFPRIWECSKEREEGAGHAWYLMDYVSGKSLAKLIEKTRLPAEIKKSAVREYAQMLNFVHKRDLIYVDNNWGATILQPDGKFGFIDFDLITKKDSNWILQASQRRYSSEEHSRRGALPTKISDLESFAKMIDHIYVGDAWLPDYEAKEKFENNPIYPEARKSRIPPPLDDVVEQLLMKPRNNKITIDDLLSAIDKI